MDLIEVKSHSKEERESMVTEKIRKNPWILSTIVLTILIIMIILFTYSTNPLEINSKEEVATMLVGFYESQGLEDIEVISVEELENLYKININYQGEMKSSYVTKNGI